MLCWQMLIAFWRPLSEWVFSQLALALSIKRLQPACQEDPSNPRTSISWRGGYFCTSLIAKLQTVSLRTAVQWNLNATCGPVFTLPFWLRKRLIL